MGHLLNMLLKVGLIKGTFKLNKYTYLAQIPEIGQALGRFLSCGARK